MTDPGRQVERTFLSHVRTGLLFVAVSLIVARAAHSGGSIGVIAALGCAVVPVVAVIRLHLRYSAVSDDFDNGRASTSPVLNFLLTGSVVALAVVVLLTSARP